MGNWIIERYGPSNREEWDRFVTGSRNGTFLFMRGYAHGLSLGSFRGLFLDGP